MTYYLNLFSPATFEAFSRSQRDVSGFQVRHRKLAAKVQPGDRFICYVTKVSRWCGVLEVVDGPFDDDRPIFYPEADPFVVRFHVRPLVWLAIDMAVPIGVPELWNHLSFTTGYERKQSAWAQKVKGSLTKIRDDDALLLQTVLNRQLASDEATAFPLENPDKYQRLLTQVVRTETGTVPVSVPGTDDTEDEAETAAQDPVDGSRESHRMQALLGRIGADLGMKVWIPRSDRTAVLKEWPGGGSSLLDRLPLNYDDVTLQTIEQIDVLWLKGRAIRRAFEVEQTTAVYSGLLRMADLLALQPNMDVKLHIVAPDERRTRVFKELTRPVFALFERGPMSDIYSYVSYSSLQELGAQQKLSYMTEGVLEEYEEFPE